jgi:hypothetical protein
LRSQEKKKKSPRKSAAIAVRRRAASVNTPVSPSGVIGKSRVGVNENTSGGALKLGVDFGIALVGILSKICPSVLIAAMSCGLQIGVALVGRYWLEVSSKQACCALWRDQLARRGMRRVLSLLS